MPAGRPVADSERNEPPDWWVLGLVLGLGILTLVSLVWLGYQAATES